MAVQRYSYSKDGRTPLGMGYFKVGSFQCGNEDTILLDPNLVTVLDNLRKALGFLNTELQLGMKVDTKDGLPGIGIQSGYRSNDYATANNVGYVGDPHTRGIAADIFIMRDATTGSPGIASDFAYHGSATEENNDDSEASIACALQAIGHKQGIGRIGGGTNVHVDVRGSFAWFDEPNGEATVYNWYNYYSGRSNVTIPVKNFEKYQADIKKALETGTQIEKNTKDPLKPDAISVTSVKFDNSKRVNRIEKTTKTENRHLGIDVSGWNHPMNWKKIKEFGVEFAILKIARVGNSYDWDAESLYSDSTVDECIKNEIPFGVYIYSYCSNPSQMTSACVTIREKLKALKERAGQWFALPCYLDVEELWIFDTGIDNVHNINKAFLQEIQDKAIILSDGTQWHCPAGIYTTASGWADSLYNYIETEDKDRFAYKNYSIWEANIINHRPSINFPIDIWQYLCIGRIPGHDCNFDFDYGYFDLNIEKNLVNVSTSSSGSATKQRTAEDIYNEILRADFDSSGDVSAADARLILKKSAKLLPKESDEIFKTYNKLIEWKLAIPQGQDELKNNFQFLDKTFNTVQENYIRKSFVDFYGDKDDPNLEIPINDYENEFSQYKKSINMQFRYNKLTGDLNLDGIVSQKDVDLAMQMICGETTFDQALMIFPKASLLMNCYAIYKNAQGEKLDDEQSYYDWQENVFKPYFYKKVIKNGLRDAVMRIAQNDYRLINHNAINEIWTAFLNWVYSQYNSLKIFYRGIEAVSSKQVILMDIAKYLPPALGAEDITDCISILFHVLGISTLSIEDFKKLNYAIDRELNLYDAYVNYLCICVYVQSIQEHLVELFNKNGEEVENFIDENSEKLFDYWFVPTANDVVYDEKGEAHGANPFIAFRDIVRAVFSLAPDKDYAQASYESFFKEPWSEKFFGTIDCPIGNGIHETFSYILKSETNEVEFFLPEWQKEDEEGIISSKILDYYKSFLNGEMTIKEKNKETGELEDRSINAYTIKRKTLFTKLIPNEFTKEEEGNDYKIFKLDDDWYMFNLNGFYKDKSTEEIIPLGQYYRLFQYYDLSSYYCHYRKIESGEGFPENEIQYYEIKKEGDYIINFVKAFNITDFIPDKYYKRISDFESIDINLNSFQDLIMNGIDLYIKTDAPPTGNSIHYEYVNTATKKMNFQGKTEEESIELVNNIYYPNLYNVYVTEYTYPNSDKPAPVGQFFSTPVTYERLKWSLFITLLAQVVKYCVTKLDEAIENIQTKSLWSGARMDDPNKKISQELIEGSEAEMIDYFFGTKFKDLPTREEVINDPDKYSNNDETLEDHISTLFRSVYHDDPNPTHHYNFYTVQNNKIADLGSYYPIDHAEEAFYYKDKNGKYTNLNFNDTISSLNNEITLPNTNIVLNANHSLKKILHENLMVFEKIMDWDFWKQPIPMTDLMNEETVKNIIKENEKLKNQEWMPQRNKFFRTDINVPGFTITKEGDLEIVDHNQAIFFLKMLSLMYPGIMKYRKDDFNYDTGWVKGLTENPEKLVFWIDFLDDVGEISKYSVKNIGQRQKVVTQDNVRAIKYLDTEKTVFIEPGLPTKENTKQAKFAATHQGYSYFQLGRRFMEQLALSGQGIDAYTVIENMLYNYAQCAESVTMSTIPLYFLEPNSRLQVYNPDTDVNSTYVLSKLSIPLGHSGTMSLTMTKALEDNVVRGEITKV